MRIALVAPSSDGPELVSDFARSGATAVMARFGLTTNAADSSLNPSAATESTTAEPARAIQVDVYCNSEGRFIRKPDLLVTNGETVDRMEQYALAGITWYLAIRQTTAGTRADLHRFESGQYRLVAQAELTDVPLMLEKSKMFTTEVIRDFGIDDSLRHCCHRFDQCGRARTEVGKTRP